MKVSLACIPSWWVILGAAVLYTGALPWFYVGAFNDDAAYISGALSLWQGHYRELYLAGNPPMTVYPPGYPLFLMPFVKAVQPHWELLRFTSVALWVINISLAWKLFGLWLSPSARVGALLFSALSPALVVQSGAVMSESLFMTILIASLLMMHRTLAENCPSEAWLLGILVGYAGLIRAAGILLLPAIVFGLIYGRRSAAAMKVLIGSLLMLGSWSYHTHQVTQQWSGYAAAWQSTLTEMTNPWVFIHNMNQVTYAFLATVLPMIDLPYTPVGFLITAILAVSVIGIIGRGLYARKSLGIPARSLLMTMTLLVAAWYVVHILWNSPSPRYALSVLPILVGLLTGGISSLLAKSTQSLKRAGWGALGVLGLVCVYSDAVIVYQARRPLDSKPERPSQTQQWIRENVPPFAIIQTAKSAETYLYTGRSCIGLMIANDAEHYRYSLLRSSATHIFARPMKMPTAGVNVDNAWRKNQRWAASWPEAFRTLYRNPVESTAIYAVVDDPAYLQAYEWYRKAKEAFEQSRFESGYDNLNKALACYPRFSSALNAYGAALLIQGTDLPAAEAKLLAAVRIRPSYPLALLNLARVYRLEERHEMARQALDQAAMAIDVTGEFQNLRPVIFRELQTH